MKRKTWRIGWRRATYLIVAAAVLTNSGCALIAAGVAGGAALGYTYCKGKVCETYNAGFEDGWAATHTALADLGMPVTWEQRQAAGGFIESRTADGERVRIYVDAEISKFPAEGPLTRVCVRVATFGDHPVSIRVLDQVGAHLVAVPMNGPPLAPAPPPTIESPPPAASATTPPQTAPPPLAK